MVRVFKERINPYIRSEVKTDLVHFAKRMGISESEFVEMAIRSVTAPDSRENFEKALLNKLDKINRHLERIDRDMLINNETMMQFIQVYLTHLTEIPESQKSDARATGGFRFKKFMDALKEKLKGNRLFTTDIISEVTAPEAEFEMEEEFVGE